MAASTGAFSAVTVFGGATFDRIARCSEPPVMGASNPGTLRHSPGGVGFNVATILARVGIKTRLVTKLAADRDGKAIAATAKKCGVLLVTNTPPPKDAPSATYTATFDNAGGLVIGVADMAICDWIAPADAAAAIGDAPPNDFWVVDANLPSDTLSFIAGEAEHRDYPLAALTVSPAKAVRLTPVLDRIDFLFANRLEAAALLDLDPAVGAGARQAARYASALADAHGINVVVTNGGEPLASASRGDVRAHAPLRARIKAVNGAGDSLAAGTIRGLADGMALPEAVRLGLAAAALTIEAGGVLDAPFSEDAVAERMAGGPPPVSA